jgi:outer membrane protein TolC
MKIKILYLVFGLLITNSFFGQTEEYLKKIEENNLQLKAAREKKQQKEAEAHTGIYPKPLSVNYGYFPDNNTVVDKKQTFNVTQSFYTPGVYKTMKSIASKRSDIANLSYKAKRKDVLSQAQKLMIKLIYSKKMKERWQKRVSFAKKRLNAVQKELDAGNANALELNKAEFHLLRMKRGLNEQNIQHKRLTEQLNMLNGGKALGFEADKYPVFTQVDQDSIFREKKAELPSVEMAKQKKEQSESMVDLQRKMNLPELKVGYGSETVGNSSFRGMLVGISVPLWSNKNKVKAARAGSAYAEASYKSRILDLKSETARQYNTYLSLKESLQDYRSTIQHSDNIKLLQKSLELGKISVIDYYREVQYYYDMYDEYLKVEREYYLALAELYRYRL